MTSFGYDIEMSSKGCYWPNSPGTDACALRAKPSRVGLQVCSSCRAAWATVRLQSQHAWAGCRVPLSETEEHEAALSTSPGRSMARPQQRDAHRAAHRRPAGRCSTRTSIPLLARANVTGGDDVQRLRLRAAHYRRP